MKDAMMNNDRQETEKYHHVLVSVRTFRENSAGIENLPVPYHVAIGVGSEESAAVSVMAGVGSASEGVVGVAAAAAAALGVGFGVSWFS